MLDRIFWFLSGLIAGGVVTKRALRRSPAAGEWWRAGLETGADLLDVMARWLRPSRGAKRGR